MSILQAATLDHQARILKTIAHPQRLRIIQILTEQGEQTVSSLMQKVSFTDTPAEQSLMSHHLIQMRDRGLLSVRRQGKNIYYGMSNEVRVETLNRSLSITCFTNGDSGQ